jgi:hypothetical protein
MDNLKYRALTSLKLELDKSCEIILALRVQLSRFQEPKVSLTAIAHPLNHEFPKNSIEKDPGGS